MSEEIQEVEEIPIPDWAEAKLQELVAYIRSACKKAQTAKVVVVLDGSKRAAVTCGIATLAVGPDNCTAIQEFQGWQGKPALVAYTKAVTEQFGVAWVGYSAEVGKSQIGRAFQHVRRGFEEAQITFPNNYEREDAWERTLKEYGDFARKFASHLLGEQGKAPVCSDLKIHDWTGLTDEQVDELSIAFGLMDPIEKAKPREGDLLTYL